MTLIIAANVLNIMIMRKETFAIHLETEMARDQLMKDLLDCIEYAATGKSHLESSSTTTPADF